jgi:hypothetical protein
LRYRNTTSERQVPAVISAKIGFWSIYYNGSAVATSLEDQMSALFFLFLARQPPVGHSLLIHEVSRSHTTTHHSRQDSSGRVISPSQRPLPDNTQHSRQTSMQSVGFEPTISAAERPQNYASHRTSTGTGNVYIRAVNKRQLDVA